MKPLYVPVILTELMNGSRLSASCRIVAQILMGLLAGNSI